MRAQGEGKHNAVVPGPGGTGQWVVGHVDTGILSLFRPVPRGRWRAGVGTLEDRLSRESQSRQPCRKPRLLPPASPSQVEGLGPSMAILVCFNPQAQGFQSMASGKLPCPALAWSPPSPVCWL